MVRVQLGKIFFFLVFRLVANDVDGDRRIRCVVVESGIKDFIGSLYWAKVRAGLTSCGDRQIGYGYDEKKE